jgi:hypothetical protein
MDTPRISHEEFMNKYPPRKKRESIFSKYRKEISDLRRKGYTIPQIVTYFELVVGQKVSRFSVRNYLSSLNKKTPRPLRKTTPEPTNAASKGESLNNLQPRKEKISPASPPSPADNLSRTAKKQEMESRAAKYDT